MYQEFMITYPQFSFVSPRYFPHKANHMSLRLRFAESILKVERESRLCRFIDLKGRGGRVDILIILLSSTPVQYLYQSRQY